MAKIGIIGATGGLGKLVVKELVAASGPDNVVALVRSPEKAEGMGVEVRHADYDKPETLGPALKGIHSFLFISSPEIGNRMKQQTATIAAAKKAGVKFIVYTSMIHADTSAVEAIARDDVATEALLKHSGVPHTILRVGFYTENHMQALEGSLTGGAFLGCASASAKFSSAPRSDYAKAAAAILLGDHQKYAGSTIELAGDPSAAYTLPELAAEVAKRTGKPFEYERLPREEYEAMLSSIGFPDHVAKAYALFDVEAERGGMFHEGTELRELLGHPTTPMPSVLPAWLPTA